MAVGCGAPPDASSAVSQGDPEPPLGQSTEAASETAEQAPAITAGQYTYSDGTVLTVSEDGSLTYEPKIYGYVAGVPVAGTVKFSGTVDEQGNVTLTKALYRGIDITKGGARNGDTIEQQWVDYAAAMYVGLQYYGSVDLTR